MIVPLEGKAKGFSITGANPYEGLMEGLAPNRLSSQAAGGWRWHRQDTRQGVQADSGQTGLGSKNGAPVYERPESPLHDSLDLVDDLNAGNHRGVCGDRSFRERQSGRLGQLQERACRPRSP